jgi:hypothetical protein
LGLGIGRDVDRDGINTLTFLSCPSVAWPAVIPMAQPNQKLKGKGLPGDEFIEVKEGQEFSVEEEK